MPISGLVATAAAGVAGAVLVVVGFEAVAQPYKAETVASSENEISAGRIEDSR
jgi:hypothetical protein